MEKELYQCTGYFVAKGYRTQFFMASGKSYLEAETRLFELIEEYAKEMGCINYKVQNEQ